MKYGTTIKIDSCIYFTLTKHMRPGIETAQFYWTGEPQIANYEQKQIIDHCDKYNKNFYVHLPCSMYATTANKNKKYLENACKIIEPFESSNVLHIGTRDGFTGIKVFKVLGDYIDQLEISPKTLLLENSAGQGKSISEGQVGSTWKELRQTYDEIDANIGFCLDTQHAFASGMCDFETEQDVHDLIDSSIDLVNKRKILLHLNDSKSEFYSQVDRHENLGVGKIWKKGMDTLYTLIHRCKEENIDIILETPESGRNTDLHIIKGILEM